MAARPVQPAPNMEVFDAYFRRADLDRDGRISGAEAVAFFQGSNLPKHVLAQIWMYSDSNRTSFLGRQEFYNALRLVTVAQSGRELTPEIIKAALEGPAAAKIPAPQISAVMPPTASGNQMPTQRPVLNSMMAPSPQIGNIAPATAQNFGFRGPQVLPNANMNQQTFSFTNGQYLRPNQAAPVIPSRPLVGQGFLGGGIASGPHIPNSSALNISTDWPSGRIRGASVGGISQSPRGTAISVMQDGFGLPQSGLRTSVTTRAEVPADTSSVPPKLLDSLSSFQPSAKDSKALFVSGNGVSTNSVFGDDVFSAMPPSKQDASSAGFAPSSVSSSSSVVSMASGLQTSVRPIQNALSQSGSTLVHGGNQLQMSIVKQGQPGTIPNALASTPVVSVGLAGPASSPSERSWPKISQKDIQKYSKVFAEVDTDKDGKITGEQARELFLSWKLPREVLKQVWDLSDQDNDSMLSHREFAIALYLMERYREGYPLPAVLPDSVRFDEALLQATAQPSAAYTGPAWQPRPGFPPQGMHRMRPVVPVAELKPQAQVQVPPQIDDPFQMLQQKKPRGIALETRLVDQPGKEEQNSLNSNFQEATGSDKKVQELEKEIMDSKEKMEYYRTKMQELVLSKSRCDNRLNEISEKASVDKREVESLAKKYEEKYKQVADVASKLTVEEATFRDVQERKLELHNAIVKMEQGGSVDGLLQVRADRIQSDLEELMRALDERCKKQGLHVKSSALVELPFGWEPGVQEGAALWDEDWDKFEDKGFVVAKELTAGLEKVVSSPNNKFQSVGIAKASPDNGSPVGNSLDDDMKLEMPSSLADHITEGESAYAHSEDGSMGSPPISPPGRTSLESPSQEFHSVQFGMHDTSPRIKESQSDHAGDESTTSGGIFADETSWGAAFDTNNDADSIWDFNTKDSDHDGSKQRSFFGSGDFGLNPIKTDSPSAGSVFGRNEKSPFFADSVPGTPAFNSGSSPHFNQGPEDHSFDSFGRFDSFSTHDSTLFPQRENLARFDSMQSSSDQSRRFAFDDPDPFGSTGPFKSTESQTPRRASDKWSAF